MSEENYVWGGGAEGQKPRSNRGRTVYGRWEKRGQEVRYPRNS